MNLSTILAERLAIVGGTGSGKSYTARGLVEKALHAGGRVGIIDPTGVWHGLRVNADGKRAGFPVVIFGGDRSDVPLIETAGRVVAQAVASTHQSWIIDTSALKSKAAERRFMLDFLDALFEANREDITLVVDEADRFSPQRMSPETARLHERMEEIVRRGRVRGFTPWLITQRPASLNKDVLSQATAMICMRMTGKHDRDAMAAVIEGQADKQVAKAIVDAMPRHKVGSGLVWAPQQDILIPVHFPTIVTLDTMRAPRPGERRAESKLPPIDIGALREKLIAVEAEAKANDPGALKRRIAELERAAKAAPTPNLLPDSKALVAEYERGYAAGLEWAFESMGSRGKDVLSVIDGVQRQLHGLREIVSSPFERMDIPHTPRAASPPPAAPHRQSVVSPPPRRDAGAVGNLGKAERLILTALAQAGTPLPIDRVGAIAGYSAKAGHFNNTLGGLRTKGYLRPGQPLEITPEGLEALGDFDPLPTGPDLLEYWKGRVGKAERAILDALAAGLTDKDAVAAHAGYSAGAGHFNNCLGHLRTLGLIEGSRNIKLHEDLR